MKVVHVHIRLELKTDEGTNISHKGSPRSRESLEDVHSSRNIIRVSLFFTSPGFSLDTDIVVDTTLYLNCRKVQNSFNPVVCYSGRGGGEENTSLTYSSCE